MFGFTGHHIWGSRETCPVSCGNAGAADRLSDPIGSEMLYQNASSADKTLKIYEGYYHEILNEPGREQVLADVESWLELHVEPSQSTTDSISI